MDTATGLFEYEKDNGTLVLTPQRDLWELDYKEIEEAKEELSAHLAADPTVQSVIVDFDKTDALGSTALALLVRLEQLVRDHHGRMALCNVSAHEGDIFRVTGLAERWRAYPSRAAAIAALRGPCRPKPN
jgi:stage II sporulation protein AA (anti-sigma F factor antagonist)